MKKSKKLILKKEKISELSSDNMSIVKGGHYRYTIDTECRSKIEGGCGATVAAPNDSLNITCNSMVCTMADC